MWVVLGVHQFSSIGAVTLGSIITVENKSLSSSFFLLRSEACEASGFNCEMYFDLVEFGSEHFRTESFSGGENMSGPNDHVQR